MIIKSVEVFNFMPFKGKQVINVEDGIYSIVAQYQNNPERSNRAGKSSLIDAISYCLYGSSRAKKETELIYNTEKEMYVQIVFDDDFIIKRGRNSANTGYLETPVTCQGDGGAKQLSQEIINEYLGMTEVDFENTCYFKQKDIFGFLEASQTDKKKFITRWIEKQQWKEYEDVCKERVKQEEKTCDQILNNINLNEQNLVDAEGLTIRRKTASQLLTSCEKVIEKHTQDIESLKDRLKTIVKTEDITKEINKVESQLESLQRDITRYNSRITVLQNQQVQKQTIEAKLKEAQGKTAGLKDYSAEINEVKKQKEELTSKRSVLNANVENSRKEYAKYKNLTDGKCPHCGNDVTKEHIQKELARITEEGKTNKSQLDTIDAQIKVIEAKVGQLEASNKSYNDLNNEINNYKSSLNVFVDSTKEIENIQQDIKKANDNIAEGKAVLIEWQNKLKDCDDGEYRKYSSELSNKTVELESAKTEQKKQIAEIAIVDNCFKKNEEVKKKLEELDAQYRRQLIVVERWRFLRYMFSPQGIVSYQIENSFQHIEDEINYLAEKLELNSYIEFSSVRALDKWEVKCLLCDTPFEKGEKSHICKNCGAKREKATKDELTIKINHAGIDEEFSMDSGGGQTLIAICFRIAIARMLKRNLNSKLEFLILDEIFGMLDSVNRGLLTNLIMNFLQAEMGFRQIFIVSHTPELKSIGTNEIKVLRHSNYSEIQN